MIQYNKINQAENHYLKTSVCIDFCIKFKLVSLDHDTIQ